VRERPALGDIKFDQEAWKYKLDAEQGTRPSFVASVIPTQETALRVELDGESSSEFHSGRDDESSYKTEAHKHEDITRISVHSIQSIEKTPDETIVSERSGALGVLNINSSGASGSSRSELSLPPNSPQPDNSGGQSTSSRVDL